MAVLNVCGVWMGHANLFAGHRPRVVIIHYAHTLGYRYGRYGAALLYRLHEAPQYKLTGYQWSGAVMHKYYAIILIFFQAILHAVVAGFPTGNDSDINLDNV